MTVTDKHNIISRLNTIDNVVIELGCGERKRDDTWIGVDSRDFECVDIIGDVYEVLEQLPANSVDKICSFHFFEHVEDLDKLLKYVSRVMKSGGDLEVTVPHFSNPFYYSDHTHKSFFGLYTFSYFSDDRVFKRTVPNYSGETNFTLIKVELVFKSFRPYYLRHSIKKIIGYIFNLNTYMKELYEENFTYFFPCYELKYSLKIK